MKKDIRYLEARIANVFFNYSCLIPFSVDKLCREVQIRDPGLNPRIRDPPYLQI